MGQDGSETDERGRNEQSSIRPANSQRAKSDERYSHRPVARRREATDRSTIPSDTMGVIHPNPVARCRTRIRKTIIVAPCLDRSWRHAWTMPPAFTVMAVRPSIPYGKGSWPAASGVYRLNHAPTRVLSRDSPSSSRASTGSPVRAPRPSRSAACGRAVTRHPRARGWY